MTSLDRLRLSPLQRAAVVDERSPLLVAAGAGSGKTSLLVAYFVHALVDEGVPPDRLVAVTFTRKAASELAERIRKALESLGRADLARSLDAASIGTIHSLCRRLIRERPLEAGVDPACTVLEGESAALIKDQISREAWDRVVERAPEEQLEVLAGRGERLRGEMVPLYDRLRGLGWERPQIQVATESQGDTARFGLRRVLGDALAAGAAVERVTPTLQSDLERLQACCLWLDQEEPTACGAGRLERAASFFPSRKTRSLEPAFEPVRAALTLYRTAQAGGVLRPLVDVMNELLAEFHRQYQAHKEERGLLDFADLELRARDLVLGPGHIAAAPDSRVLIDEFQDTNELQCGILEGLGAARLLMVGDEAQSIYRFRGADVDVFRRRRSTLVSSAADGVGGLHRLDVNYRSRPEILAFVNRLFSHDAFLGPGFTNLRSPEADELRPDTTGTGDHLPCVEVLVVSRAEETGPNRSEAAIQRAEARAVASSVRNLVDHEGFAQRSIVVLLPAQTHVNIFQQALLEKGLAVYIVRGQGYYSQEEVTDVVSLLRLLVNPHDDLALVSVLRSPLVCISDDALYLLGSKSRRRASLWDAVARPSNGGLPEEDRRRLSHFVEWVEGLRRRVGRPGLARLIDEAVSRCDYDVCVLGSVEGKRRFANIRKLMRLAGEYEALEGPDLAGFVGLLQSMGDMTDREGSAPTLAEGEDVVRVMTVHQAKGLEFPAVVLAGLGSDVPRGPTGEFVVADDGRVGVFLKDSRRATYEPYDLCLGPGAQILEQERVKEREEDVRLLYVAMTRAESKLVLVGARPGGDGLEGSRIGRIVAALGLDAFPPEGVDALVEETDAVVRGIPAWAEEEQPPEPQPRPVAGTAAPPERAPAPRFLEPVSGRATRLRVSFSALAAYERCPRRYYLERVLGLDLGEEVRLRDPDDETPAQETYSPVDDEERDAGRDVGLLVHALLERAPGEGRATEATLRGLAGEWLRQTGARLSPGGEERAVALALAFWDSPSAVAAKGPAAQREVPFVFAHDGVMVSGVMDLVNKGPSLWHIVDYKTNSLVGRTLDQVASAYQLQADVYCLAALRAGAPKVRMDFVFLERPQSPITTAYGPEAIPRLEQRVDKALGGLRGSQFPERRDSQCERCPVADICGVMAQA